MASSAVSALAASAALVGTELFYADDLTNDVKVTPDKIATYALNVYGGANLKLPTAGTIRPVSNSSIAIEVMKADGVTPVFTFDTSTVAATLARSSTLPAGGTAGHGMKFGSSGIGVFYGSGAPTLVAPQGSMYLRNDGTSTNTRMYINQNASTTWTAVTTAA